MSFLQSLPDSGITDLVFYLCGQVDIQTNDGVFDLLLLGCDGVQQGRRGINVIRFQRDVNGEKAADIVGVKFERYFPFWRQFLVYVSIQFATATCPGAD